jgi:predicted TIM-barrel fold metal-dependent hydrolase
MILDVDVLLGRWPFAPLEYDTVDGVLTLMDRAGIDVGIVTSLDSVFYYDCETGNRRVGEACKQHPDRFVPLAVINPNLLSWKEHLDECLDAFAIKGIKLHPDFHKFSLLGEPAAGVMGEARRLGLAVYLQTSILDMRHHPGYCFVPEVPIAEVARAVERYPENTFIIGGGKHFAGRVNELLRNTDSENFYVVTDGLGGPFDGLGGLVQRIGSDRLLFGTRTPILYAEAAKWTVEQSTITEQDKTRILGENTAQLLGLES